ncbi:MAG: glyoxalase/bleomycin resistance/dioxygenase family protein, partial [Bacteroidota bacterium]
MLAQLFQQLMSVKPTAILIHVHSLVEAREWYKSAFPTAREIYLEAQDFVSFEIDGFTIELVMADEQVSSGKAGSVL